MCYSGILLYLMCEIPMIKWKDKNHLSLNNYPVFVMSDDLPLKVAKQHTDGLFIQRTRAMLNDYAALRSGQKIKNILEIGLFKGGSMPYFLELFEAKKIVGVDINAGPLETLQHYILEQSLQKQIKPYYGINQADSTAMSTILAKEFPRRDINLIVDDASHFLRETRASFNTCFPWLQPGGFYVIEDWRWAHGMKETPMMGGKVNLDLAKKIFGNQPPMSLLGLQLVMACGTRPDVISRVSFNFHFITVTRGPAPLDENFDIRNYYNIHNKECITEEDKLW